MAEVRARMRWKRISLGFLGALIAAGVFAWFKRADLQAWYYARQVQRTTEAERPGWIERLVDLGESAGPKLIGCLENADAGICDSARSGLARLMRSWGPDDPRSRELAHRVTDRFDSLSDWGKSAALDLFPDFITAAPDAVPKLKAMVAAALQARAAEIRAPAIACALRPEIDLLDSVVPLLKDENAEVRRAAMLAVGPARDDSEPAVSTDELLRWLHDEDSEVRKLCAMALRSRGLSERDVRLARQLTDPAPVERLNLLIQLPRDEDFAAASWLERLSNDPSSAVRAGAVRVAVERRVDLSERLEEMCRTDPDATVRRIAAHYHRLRSR